jgi:hypothetical protein
MKKLFCQKHSRILIGKSKCVDCKKENKLPVPKKRKLVPKSFIRTAVCLADEMRKEYDGKVICMGTGYYKRMLKEEYLKGFKYSKKRLNVVITYLNLGWTVNDVCRKFPIITKAFGFKKSKI